MPSTPQKLINSMRRLLSPSRRTDKEQNDNATPGLENTMFCVCASNQFCSTPNQSCKMSHNLCVKCGKKMHAWCRGIGLTSQCNVEADYNSEYCIPCSNGVAHPENAGYDKPINLNSILNLSTLSSSFNLRSGQEEFRLMGLQDSDVYSDSSDDECSVLDNDDDSSDDEEENLIHKKWTTVAIKSNEVKLNIEAPAQEMKYQLKKAIQIMNTKMVEKRAMLHYGGKQPP